MTTRPDPTQNRPWPRPEIAPTHTQQVVSSGRRTRAQNRSIVVVSAADETRPILALVGVLFVALVGVRFVIDAHGHAQAATDEDWQLALVPEPAAEHEPPAPAEAEGEAASVLGGDEVPDWQPHIPAPRQARPEPGSPQSPSGDPVPSADQDQVEPPAKETGTDRLNLAERPRRTFTARTWDNDQARSIATLPRRIVTVANTKGGVGKTPLAVVITQALAHLAGHHDLALVEINPVGTLRRRTRITHDGCLESLIAEAETNPDFGWSPRDLDTMLTWQDLPWAALPSAATARRPDGSYWPPLTCDATGLALDVVLKTCRMIVLDTGNDPRDAAWQEGLRRSDRIIVPVSWEPDVMGVAAQMIDDLAAERDLAQLKRDVIFVETHAPLNWPKRGRAAQYRAALHDDGWQVMNLPPDRHLAEGALIEWHKLAGRTRTAALALAQEVAA